MRTWSSNVVKTAPERRLEDGTKFREIWSLRDKVGGFGPAWDEMVGGTWGGCNKNEGDQCEGQCRSGFRLGSGLLLLERRGEVLKLDAWKNDAATWNKGRKGCISGSDLSEERPRPKLVRLPHSQPQTPAPPLISFLAVASLLWLLSLQLLVPLPPVHLTL